MSGNVQDEDDYAICVQPSMLWMLGVIFPTEEEVKAVENVSK